MTEQSTSRQNIISILLTCVGYGYFTINDGASKILASKFHFTQMMSINGLLISIFIVLIGVALEGKRAFQTKKIRLMIWRAIVGQISAITTLLSLPHVHLTTFYTLVFTSPFWVSLMSVLVLKEKLEFKRLLVIVFGFLVVIYMFRPGSGLLNIWAVLICIGSLTYSYALIIARQIGSGESRYMMILAGCLMSFLITIPFTPAHFIMPTAYEWGLFGMMSFLAAIGILCVAYGIQVASSPAVVVPYHYTQLLWGALLGYFIFDEVPDVHTMIGAGIIMLAGLFLIFSEVQEKKKILSLEDVV